MMAMALVKMGNEGDAQVLFCEGRQRMSRERMRDGRNEIDGQTDRRTD